jgi:pterin-4a-carbinolamine dehydratase
LYLEDGWLRRKYTTDGWPTTLMLTNAIGYLCEAAYHHADLAITWGKLWVKLQTHSAGGITDKDFELAQKIEEVVLWRPAPGGDAYLIARLWAWWPMLELEEGKTYRLHLSSMDFLHGFSLQPENINIQVHPGYEHILTVTPTKAGTYSIICNEYCGINHHTMASRLYVVKQ